MKNLLSIISRFLISLSCALWLLVQVIVGQQLFNTQLLTVKATILNNKLNQPWSMSQLNDNQLLITEKRGRLLTYDLLNKQSIMIENVPEVISNSQGGLLDTALDIDFANNDYIYLSYTTKNGNDIVLNLAQAKLVDNSLQNLNIFYQIPARGASNIGSRFLWYKNDLLATIGDRFDADKAQDLNSPLGKIMRFNKQLQPIPTASLKAIDGIYSYGNRNPQGIIYDQQRDILWSVEHGPMGGDEVNIIQEAQNYGWPLVSFGRNYDGSQVGKGLSSGPGLTAPLWHWTPSIAPSALAIYDKSLFSSWQGNLLVTALRGAYLARLTIDDDNKIIAEERLFTSEWGRLRDVLVDKSGVIYLITDQIPGLLVKLEPYQKQ